MPFFLSRILMPAPLRLELLICALFDYLEMMEIAPSCLV
uniref:Uncharacterized protein n=1 Tax=Rhizophora mucronata TaxID=61149 RepID=A0A2P2PP10_RHIMU